MNDRMPNRASCRVLGSFDEPSNTCDFSVSKVRARRQQGDSPRPIEAVQHVGIAPKSTTVWLNIFNCSGLYNPVWTTFETSITLLRARRIVAVGLKSAKWFSIFVSCSSLQRSTLLSTTVFAYRSAQPWVSTSYHLYGWHLQNFQRIQQQILQSHSCRCMPWHIDRNEKKRKGKN